MIYREELPPDCPPAAAETIVAPRRVYRIVRTNPPTQEDFRSQRAEHPKRRFSLDECHVRGVSVFGQADDARRQVAKLGKFRGSTVCGVDLTEGAGVILKTGKRSHHTWWPLADFNILNRCSIEE